MREIRATAWLLAATAAAGLCFPAPAGAIPIRCEGSLTDSGGRPLEGAFLLNFRLWKASGLGEAQWKASRYVSAKGGRFIVTLGEEEAIPDEAVQKGYRLTIDPPPGTGWAAEVVSNQLVKAARKTAPPRAPALADSAEAGRTLPARTQARAPVEPVEDTARGFYARPSAPKPALNVVSKRSSSDPAILRIEADLAKTREEALRAKRDAAESRRRLEELEREVKKSSSRSSESAVSIYVVRSGDTLRSIASRLYRDPERWMDLYQANHDRLQRGGELVPGQRLVVPGQ